MKGGVSRVLGYVVTDPGTLGTGARVAPVFQKTGILQANKEHDN